MNDSLMLLIFTFLIEHVVQSNLKYEEEKGDIILRNL